MLSEPLGLQPELTSCEPIPKNQTLTLINQFIVDTVSFLTKFSSLCEQKLDSISRQTYQLEVSLALLETRLSSVPWISDSGSVQAAPAPSLSSVSSPAPSTASAAPVSAPAAPVEAVPEPEPATNQMLLKDEPRYSKYFKMLKMGVPMQVLRQKLTSEGLDPDVLE